MLYSLGLFIYQRRWAVIAFWVIVLLVSLPLLPQASQNLQFGGFTSQRMESVRARQLLESSIGARPSTLVVLFTSPALTVDDPEFSRQVAYAMDGLKDAPEVAQVVDHLTNPRQISRDRHTAYELVVLKLDDEEAARGVPGVVARLRDPASQPPSPISQPLQMHVTGGPLFFSEVERLSHEDLQRAEIVAFPIAAVALLLVFGSVVAAGLPVALGGATVVGILATIALLSRTTELSIFVMNVATMLGLGLGVDYSLFMTSRFREELQRRGEGEREGGSERGSAGQPPTPNPQHPFSTQDPTQSSALSR